MNKFILGENPMTDSGGLWVIHLPDPKAIIEVVPVGDKIHSKNAVYAKDCQYHDERYQLRIYHYFTSDIGLSDEQMRIKAHKMLDDAWKWLLSYLIWEDSQLNEDDNE